MERTDQAKAPLTEALKMFMDRRPVYFCIPGHRFDAGVPEDLSGACGGNIVNFDVTEAPGLDDLHNAKGAIKEAQELLAAAFGCRVSRFLVNGSTCGIEAAILSCVSEGEKLLLPRNAHRSALSGLILSGAYPVWMKPEPDPAFGFPAFVSVETLREKLDENPGIRAVLIVSPSYYGTFCDIGSIAKLTHSRGIPLIVDEAHGAHLYFSEYRDVCALPCGADISIVSAHKTLQAFGQSSALHLNGDLVSEEKVDSALKMLMSSSPSYMLMASLDSARREAALHGRDHFEKARHIAERIRAGAKNAGYDVLESEGKNDPTRVVISAAASGMQGNELGMALFEQYHIAAEMTDRFNIVLVVTAANTEEDAKKLIAALNALGDGKSGPGPVTSAGENAVSYFFDLPEIARSPRDAYFSKKRTVRIEEAKGLVAAEEIVVYPPGSSIIVPGEIYNEKIIGTIRACTKAGLTLQKGTGGDPDRTAVITE